MNYVAVTGNLTRDPETKQTAKGNDVVKFSIAHNRGSEKQAFFFDVVCWGATAETVQKYLAKGDKIIVMGELTHETWEDNNGSKRSRVVITAKNIEFVSLKSRNNQAKEQNDLPVQPNK